MGILAEAVEGPVAVVECEGTGLGCAGWVCDRGGGPVHAHNAPSPALFLPECDRDAMMKIMGESIVCESFA